MIDGLAYEPDRNKGRHCCRWPSAKEYMDLNADTAPPDPRRWIEFLQQLNRGAMETPAGALIFAHPG
jgi:hypothetical protein